MATEMPDKAYRKIINSWAMYDWASSAFVTTIMAAMFPPFYRSLVISAGLGEPNATAAGFFMQTATHFYILAFVVGTVQGGTQALSRSLYGAMVPKSQSAEFFGFFSTSSKFAGIVGPLLFGVVSQVAGGSRLSIVSLVIFFIVGGFLLTRVDEQEAMRAAREEDAAFVLSGA
jgi:MFS-type transporter involved in bile tolerance (Atg22 family)